MSIMDFTVEEINLIAIYKAATKAATVSLIVSAVKFMDDDMKDVAVNAAGKIAGLTEAEFAGIPFTPADDTDEG